MSADAISAVRRGVIALLAQHLAPVSIFDGVPRGARAPWVNFGATTARDLSTLQTRQWEIDSTLEAWSQQPGAGEALGIVGTMVQVLHHVLLPIDGYAMLDGRVLGVETTREDDWQRARLTWRTVVREG